MCVYERIRPMISTRKLVSAVILCLPATTASAEPRWCPITGHGAQDTLRYPPIARVARVSGVVVGRLTYRSDGEVLGFVPVFGPVLLAKGMSDQIMHWTVQTTAVGTADCQTLVIARFTLADEIQQTAIVQPNGNFRIDVRSYPLVISDPAAYLGRRHWWHKLRHRNF